MMRQLLPPIEDRDEWRAWRRERHVLVLPGRFVKPTGPLALAPVLIHLSPRAEGALPT